MICRCLWLYGPYPVVDVLPNRRRTTCARCLRLAKRLSSAYCFRSVGILNQTGTREIHRPSSLVSITLTSIETQLDFSDVQDHYFIERDSPWRSAPSPEAIARAARTTRQSQQRYQIIKHEDWNRWLATSSNSAPCAFVS